MPTATNRYALGRGTAFLINIPNASPIDICVSEGSIDLSADVIEIPSNCYSGWKIKLAGNKQGTVSVTGYVASSTSNTNDPFDWIGEVVSFSCTAMDQQTNAGVAMQLSSSGVVTGVRVSIDANDALRCEMTIEMSGAPTGFATIAVA